MQQKGVEAKMKNDNGKLKVKIAKKIGRTYASVTKHIERIRAGPKAVLKRGNHAPGIIDSNRAPVILSVEADPHKSTSRKKFTTLLKSEIPARTKPRPTNAIAKKVLDKPGDKRKLSKNSNIYENIKDSNSDLPAVSTLNSTSTTPNIEGSIRRSDDSAMIKEKYIPEDSGHRPCESKGRVIASSLRASSRRLDNSGKDTTGDKYTRVDTHGTNNVSGLLKQVSTHSSSSDNTSERTLTVNTDITTVCSTGCSSGDGGAETQLREIIWRLALRFRELLNKNDSLRSRNEILVASRKDDFARLLEYSEVNRTLSAEYDEMRATLIQQLKVKNTEIAQYKQKIQSLVEEKKEISGRVNNFVKIKKEEVTLLNQDWVLKEEKMHKMHDDERKHLKSRHRKEMHNLAHAAETNRQASDKVIETKDLQIKVLEAEIRENADAQNMEISRLSDDNLVLRDTVNMLQQCLTFNEPNLELVKMILDRLEDLNDTLTDTRRRVKKLQDDNEDLLDSANITRHYVDSLYKKWRDGVARAASLCGVVAERDETILLKDEVISTMENIIAKMESTKSRSSEQEKDRFETLKTDADFVSKSHWEMQELRRDLIAKQTTIYQMKRQTAKVEDEAFATEMEMTSMLAEKNKAVEDRKIVEIEAEELEKQVQFLKLALANQGRLEDNDMRNLLGYLHQQSADTKELRDSMVNLRNHYETLLSERDGDIQRLKHDKMQVVKELDVTYERYHSETLYDQQRLHERIAALMAEKGESYYAESSHPFSKISADRNALRVQAQFITSRDNMSQVSPEVFEDDYWPGAIPATIEALRKLRPLGWFPIWEMDRCWLTPVVKQFTEEDAVERIQARNEEERMAHRAALGFEVGDNNEIQAYRKFDESCGKLKKIPDLCAVEEQERGAEDEIIATLSVRVDIRSD
jgi:hypothetical protein